MWSRNLLCYLVDWISNYRETEWNKHHKQPFLPQIKSSQNSGSGRRSWQKMLVGPLAPSLTHTQLLSNLQIWVRNPQYIGPSGKIKQHSEVEERSTPAFPRKEGEISERSRFPTSAEPCLTWAVFWKKGTDASGCLAVRRCSRRRRVLREARGLRVSAHACPWLWPYCIWLPCMRQYQAGLHRYLSEVKFKGLLVHIQLQTG